MEHKPTWSNIQAIPPFFPGSMPMNSLRRFIEIPLSQMHQDVPTFYPCVEDDRVRCQSLGIGDVPASTELWRRKLPQGGIRVRFGNNHGSFRRQSSVEEYASTTTRSSNLPDTLRSRQGIFSIFIP
jgi:hypothetical protein